MRSSGIFCSLALLVLWTTPACNTWAYPLDGDSYTGIARLEGYRLAHAGEIRGPRQPTGATLPLDAVTPRLTGRTVTLPQTDAELSRKIRQLLGGDAANYGVAVLDLSDPENPRYGQHNAKARYSPGSVGKILVALALFQALADTYPDDIPAREKVLRESIVVADDFIWYDHHKVPFWDAAARRLRWRPLQKGDTASLWTYLDWMLSASSNAAASMVMRHALLLGHFGRDYPVSEPDAQAFFATTPKAQLATLLARVMQDPVTRNGLDLAQIRQGSFFTNTGKRRVPGVNSYATPEQLLRYMLLLEQGRLVDAFSSREIKRLLYMTQRRIRYASAPALAHAAVYFKSGSYYKCKPEADFNCGKYKGNVVNWMNSVATVESPAGEGRLFYIVTVMSNVLRENSAVAHQTLATRLHRFIESRHPQVPPAPATSQQPDHPVPQ